MWSTRCVRPGGAWCGSRYVKKYLGPGRDKELDKPVKMLTVASENVDSRVTQELQHS